MNDSDFVNGLRQRDPAAARHLTECYLPSLWRFVFIHVRGDHHLAEDIVSEAVLALVRAAAAGVEIQSPTAWLRSVAHHKVQDHYRAAARVQHLIEQAKQTEPPVNEEDACKQQEHAERRRQIRNVMDRLSEQHRLILEWKYLDKISVRDIAQNLGITEKAAESMLFRARCEFREKLKSDEKKDDIPAQEAPQFRARGPNQQPSLHS